MKAVSMDTDQNIIEAQKYFEIALKLHNNKKLDEALAYYFKALELYPSSAELYSNIGNVYTEKKMINQAIEMQQKAIIIDSSYYPAYYNLGIAYMEIKAYHKAIELYQKALRISNLPKEFTGNLYHNVAVCYNGLEDFENALLFCKNALAFNPNDRETKASLLLYQRKRDNYKKVDDDIIFIDRNPINEGMNKYLLGIYDKLKSNNSVYNARLSYNLLDIKMFNDKRWLFMSVANIGNTTDTAGFHPDYLKKIITNECKAYLCYIALPINEDDFLIEEKIPEETFSRRLEKLVDTQVIPVGAITYDNFQKCRTFKWIYEEVITDDKSKLPFELSHMTFFSSHHKRYESGVDKYGLQEGAHRGIEILRHESINDAYKVTMYNMDGNHPVWRTNIQMHPKRMKIIFQNDSKIELRGFGNDSIGTPFSGYGITLHLVNNDIDRVILHMFDRNVDIEYFK